MRICARLGGGSTKELGESRLTGRQRGEGEDRDGGRRIKNPAVRRRGCDGRKPKEGFWRGGIQLNKTPTKRGDEGAAVRSCM